MRRGLLGLTLVLVLALSACGADAEEGPLVKPLAAVDAAAVAEDPQALDAAVTDLLDAVETAEQAGDVDTGQARRVRAAARALLAASRSEDDAGEDPSPSAPLETDEDEMDEDETQGRGQGRGKAKGHDD